MTTTTPPITFGVTRSPAGAHELVRVWAGFQEGSRGMLGVLTASPDEATELEQRLLGPELSTADLEFLVDSLFERGRRTTSPAVRSTTVALQLRLQAELDRRNP